MRVLLLGGGGFIGTALKAAISEWVDPGVIDLATVGKYLCECDAAVNLVGSPDDPNAGTHALQSLLACAGDKRVITFGSAAEYAPNENALIVETDPCEPTSDYGRAKLTSTRLAENHSNCIVVRPSSVVGSGMRQNTLVGSVLGQLRRGEKVITVTSKQVVRDYVGVRDVANAVKALLLSTPQKHIYNISSGLATSVAEVLDHIKAITQTDFQVNETHPQGKPGELMRAVCSSARLQQELDWSPQTTIHQMVNEAWAV